MMNFILQNHNSLPSRCRRHQWTLCGFYYAMELQLRGSSRIGPDRSTIDHAPHEIPFSPAEDDGSSRRGHHKQAANIRHIPLLDFNSSGAIFHDLYWISSFLRKDLTRYGPFEYHYDLRHCRPPCHKTFRNRTWHYCSLALDRRLLRREFPNHFRRQHFDLYPTLRESTRGCVRTNGLSRRATRRRWRNRRSL